MHLRAATIHLIFVTLRTLPIAFDSIVGVKQVLGVIKEALCTDYNFTIAIVYLECFSDVYFVANLAC